MRDGQTDGQTKEQNRGKTTCVEPKTVAARWL